MSDSTGGGAAGAGGKPAGESGTQAGASGTPAAKGGEAKKSPNWAEFVTLILAIGGAAGGWYKFQTLDSNLGKVQTDLTSLQAIQASLELDRAKEPLLQITGTISESHGSVFLPGREEAHGSLIRRATLQIEMKNIGDAPVRVSDLVVVVSRRKVDESWADIVKGPVQPEAELPAPAPPQERKTDPSGAVAPATPLPAENAPGPQPDPPVIVPSLSLGMLNAYDQQAQGWSELHQWRYDPKVHAGSELAGTILRGQTRSVVVDFLIEDSPTPEILRFQATGSYKSLRPGPADVFTSHKQIWSGLIGCGPLRGLFSEYDNFSSSLSPPRMNVPENAF